MAKQVLTSNSLVLKYKSGTNAKGDDVFKSQKFSNIRVGINTEDFYAGAEAIKALLGSPVIYIQKQDDYVLEA